MKKTGPFPKFVAGSLIVAALCTICFDSGWFIWIPTILAIGVVWSMTSQYQR